MSVLTDIREWRHKQLERGALLHEFLPYRISIAEARELAAWYDKVNFVGPLLAPMSDEDLRKHFAKVTVYGVAVVVAP